MTLVPVMVLSSGGKVFSESVSAYHERGQALLLFFAPVMGDG